MSQHEYVKHPIFYVQLLIWSRYKENLHSYSYVCRSNSVALLDRLPVDLKRDTKDTCFNEIGLSAQISVNHSKLNSEHN